MKNIILILLLSIGLVEYGLAQSITPTTNAACGASLENNGILLEFSIGGNCVMEQMENANMQVPQGFPLPDCAPKGTGVIQGCNFLCAEDSVTVYEYWLDSVLNVEMVFWEITPAYAINIEAVGNNFIRFKVINDTITNLVFNATPRNVCGDGMSVCRTIELDTFCVVPGDVDRNGVVDEYDAIYLGMAVQEAQYDDLDTPPVRSLPCFHTGIMEKDSFFYHPAYDWYDIFGDVAAFGDSTITLLYKHADPNGDGNVTLQKTPADPTPDFVKTVDNFGKIETNIGKSAKSLVQGISVVPNDMIDSTGNNLLFDILVGNDTLSHTINMVYFSVEFQRGVYNRPIVVYDSSYLGSYPTNIVSGDYFEEKNDSFSTGHILIGHNNPAINRVFSGERLCGIICEIPISRAKHKSLDSLTNGSFPFTIRLTNILVTDGKGNYTPLAAIEHTFEVEPLPQPKAITATAKSATKIDVSWTNHTVKPDYLVLERYLKDTLHLDRRDTILVSDYQNIDTVNYGYYTYQDTLGIVADKYYHYRIRTLNDSIGRSYWSEWVKVLSGPAAPDSLVVRSQGYQNALLSWHDISPYAAQTLIEVNSSNTGMFVPVTGSSIEKFTHNGLQPYTEYCYRIRTENIEGIWSVYSDVECVTTMPAPPQAPQGVTTTDLGNAVQIDWLLDSLSIVDKVYINRLKYSSTGTPQGFNDTIVGTNLMTYIDTSVEAGYYYCYRLYTENASGTSFYSDTTCVLLCGMPTLVMHLNQDRDTVNLSWSDACKSEANYQLRVIDHLTGDTTLLVLPYDSEVYDYVLPLDTFSLCYDLAFEVVDGLYDSPFGNQICLDGNLTSPTNISTIVLDKPIVITPNPTKGKVVIAHPILDNLTVEIYNAQGQRLQVQSLRNTETTIYLQDLSTGVYWFTFKQNGQVIQTQQVIKVD